ncbi:MAG: SufE family protein, partial [Bacteroidales bacterium]|nr:SufE family protein [Bacteroidales bacterium]
SDKTPQEILSADLSYIDTIGLKNHLSPTRSNGLLSMIRQIKRYAIVYQAKAEQDEK